MKIRLIVVGKTQGDWLLKGISEYTRRLVHYTHFEIAEIPDIKNRKNIPLERLKLLEEAEIEKLLLPNAHIVALDERGKEFTSPGFAGWLDHKLTTTGKDIVFIIGGAYGISGGIMVKCHDKIALSQMTLSHQMVRLFFVEQLYRAFSIIKNEKYHHF